jgi:hypothetical protein
MEAYKFQTKINHRGEIYLPISPNLYEKEVDIIIITKEEQRKFNTSAIDFVNKWEDFLKNVDIEDAKYKYLMEKYN